MQEEMTLILILHTSSCCWSLRSLVMLMWLLTKPMSTKADSVLTTFTAEVRCNLESRLNANCAQRQIGVYRTVMECAGACEDNGSCLGASLGAGKVCYHHRPCGTTFKCAEEDVFTLYVKGTSTGIKTSNKATIAAAATTVKITDTTRITATTPDMFTPTAALTSSSATTIATTTTLAAAHTTAVTAGGVGITASGGTTFTQATETSRSISTEFSTEAVATEATDTTATLSTDISTEKATTTEAATAATTLSTKISTNPETTEAEMATTTLSTEISTNAETISEAAIATTTLSTEISTNAETTTEATMATTKLSTGIFTTTEAEMITTAPSTEISTNPETTTEAAMATTTLSTEIFTNPETTTEAAMATTTLPTEISTNAETTDESSDTTMMLSTEILTEAETTTEATDTTTLLSTEISTEALTTAESTDMTTTVSTEISTEERTTTEATEATTMLSSTGVTITPTTVSPCLNNGTWIEADTKCKCIGGWVGQYCERLAVSCKELASYDYPQGWPDGEMWVTLKPSNYPSPFQVKCSLNTWYFNTFLMHNRGWYRHDKTYNDFVNGYHLDDYHYWLGLDKIRAFYNLGYTKLYLDTAFNPGDFHYFQYWYEDTTIDDETGGYRINFGNSGKKQTGSMNNSYTYGDCLGPIEGSKFSAFDHDDDESVDNCAAKRGAGWWYKDCTSACNPLGYKTAINPGGPPEERMSISGLDCADGYSDSCEVMLIFATYADDATT